MNKKYRCFQSSSKREKILTAILLGMMCIVVGFHTLTPHISLAAEGEINEEYEEAERINWSLREIKAGIIMYSNDHPEQAAKSLELDAISAYTDHPEEYKDNPDYVLINKNIGGESQWLVGYHLSRKSLGVREALQAKARSRGLINERGGRYSGEDYVFMKAR